MIDMDVRLAALDEDDLLQLHQRLDGSGEADAATVEVHHLVTTEMLKRGLAHDHNDDEWSYATVLKESVTVSSPEEIDAPEGMEKAWGDALAHGGTVAVMLTVNGYVLKAEPSVSEVHVDTIMGKPKRRKMAPLPVDDVMDVEKRSIPDVITDLEQNLENRQHAIDEYLYGPMNPNKPGDYWEQLGEVWDVSADEAATTRCGNCAAFNMTTEIRTAMADAMGEGGDDVVAAADLGYCELLDFKCAAARSCSAWLVGGPIGPEDDDESYAKADDGHRITAKKAMGAADIAGLFTLPDGATYKISVPVDFEKKMSRSEAATVAANARWVGPGTGELNLKPEIKQRIRETLGNGQIAAEYGEGYAEGKAHAKGEDIYGEKIRYSPTQNSRRLGAERKKRDSNAEQLMAAPRGGMLAENLAANTVASQGFIDGATSAKPQFRRTSMTDIAAGFMSAFPSGALKAVDSEDFTKHGKHDQSSHGKRGGGSGGGGPYGGAAGKKEKEPSRWSAGMPVPPLVKDHAPGTVKDDDGNLITRTPEASSEATSLRARSQALEPATTAMVTKMAAEHGGEMTGLEQRLKTADSLARKIDADAVKEHGGDRAAAAASVSDSIRYTTVFDNDAYTAGAAATLKSLEADGYSIRAKNFWSDGDDYQGMNVKATKSGVTVELQFHTRDSVRVKETQLHPVYEEYRKSTDNTKRRELWDKMVGIAATIPKPAGYATLLTVGTLTVKNFETAQQAGLLG
jgi:hypothetical protein